MKKKIPKLLIICSTHGNEKIGLEVVEQLEIKGLENLFDVLIANPEANERKIRFVEKDLNRSYPGKQNSEKYEERLAFENLKIAKQYEYIIDIHEADEGMDDFIIVPREELSKKFPIEFIDLDKALLWPSPEGPISQVLENSIELEFGSKNRDRKRMIKKAVEVIENFIDLILNKSNKFLISKKDIYYVYGKIKISDFSGQIYELVDFCEYKNISKNEIFYPLLARQYLKEGIVCYKMRKLN